MAIDRNHIAPCGLFCGVCGIQFATRDDNQKFRERLAPVYGLMPDDINCEGCLAEGDKVFKYCRVCSIKSCAAKRGYEGCHQCDEFPCEHIDNFPIPVGKKVMLRAVPRWREVGTDRWVEEEEARYVCPHCGEKLFRGAKRCRVCKEPVDVD